MQPYLESIQILDRLHPLMLDLIKDEFERLRRDDLTPVQALLLFNLGAAEVRNGFPYLLSMTGSTDGGVTSSGGVTASGGVTTDGRAVATTSCAAAPAGPIRSTRSVISARSMRSSTSWLLRSTST